MMNDSKPEREVNAVFLSRPARHERGESRREGFSGRYFPLTLTLSRSGSDAVNSWGARSSRPLPSASRRRAGSARSDELTHQMASGIRYSLCSARRRTERPGRSRSPFPTASFRLRQREQQAADWCLADGDWAHSGTGVIERRRTILPLPRGEGRGEGELSAAHPTIRLDSSRQRPQGCWPRTTDH